MTPIETKSSHEFPQHKDIAAYLMEAGYLTEEQLKRAKRVHARLEVEERLSRVFVQLGYVTESQIREVMKKHKKDLRLGDFLIEMHLISETELQKALKLQQDEKKRLGEVLIGHGMITELNLCQALSEQLECPIIEPDLKIIDKKLLTMASVSYMKKSLFIPFSKSEDGTTVIFFDPLNNDSLRAAENIFGDKLIKAICTKGLLMDALEGYETGRTKVSETKIDGHLAQDEAIKIVDYIIQSAIEEDVSDIHIEPLSNKIRIRYRKDGALILKTELPKKLQPRVLSRIKVLSGVDITDKRHHQDGKFEYKYFNNTYDIRFSSYVTVFGENLVMRLLSMKKGLQDLPELGFGKGTLRRYIEDVLEPTTGVVIITGPTGSGKTTTLYSSIDYCNDISLKIITAEDPVEYVIEGIIQCSINEQIGLTYSDTLKAIVRQDPDIIVLGEIRDKDSARVAIQASLTGHKVFSTFHTEDSIGGLIRLVDMEIETFLISSTVISVVAQRLIRKICPFCKESYTPNPYDILKTGLHPNDLKSYTFFRGAGCKHCNYTGYKGRIGIFELLVLNEPVKDAILAKKTSYEIRKISFETTGLVTLLEDGLIKVIKGLTTFDELRRHVPYSVKPRTPHEILKLVDN